ncbi:MAG: CMP-N-acetylneuraminic acid synthetase [Nitrospina sp.]|jgi:CMP-N,N'-diacetyllegionaminic acid synthase|nr:CMP-N-acetylneuraminic acid synthetase [Nitrospina sp.]
MKTVALLTGRGNNSLKDKNILEVCGQPLMSYPALAAKRSTQIDLFYISSENEKILSIGQNLDFKRIKRPEELARPDSRHEDTIRHALDIMTKEGVHPDILVVLLANTVCVVTEWIDQCINEIKNDPEISAVVPVFLDLDHHPYRAKRLGKDGFLEPYFDFDKQDISTNRQELGDCYFLCHNFWVLNVKKSVFTENGQAPWTFMGNRIKPFAVEEFMGDVHCKEDLKRSEEWVKQNS